MNLFEKCPDAKTIFGFPAYINPRSANLLKSSRFRRHAKFLMKMIEKTVDMLGAETTSDEEHGRGRRLTDILTELGRKHVAYGVKPEFFPFMTQSILAMLQETIGDPHAEAWEDVFNFLIAGMTSGYERIQKGAAASQDKGKCMETWKRLAGIEEYGQKGGVILFQQYVICRHQLFLLQCAVLLAHMNVHNFQFVALASYTKLIALFSILHSLFEICPETKMLFGFPMDISPNSPDLLQSRRFSYHASFLVEMIEKTIGMLGEDDATIEKNLLALGQRHVSFGVKAEHFPYMTKALIFMLKTVLGSDFSSDDEDAFEHVMAMLIADLIRGQRTVDKDLAGNQKAIVTASWEKLTKIPDYEGKGGIILFQKYVLAYSGLSRLLHNFFRPLFSHWRHQYSLYQSI